MYSSSSYTNTSKLLLLKSVSNKIWITKGEYPSTNPNISTYYVLFLLYISMNMRSIT